MDQMDWIGKIEPIDQSGRNWTKVDFFFFLTKRIEVD